MKQFLQLKNSIYRDLAVPTFHAYLRIAGLQDSVSINMVSSFKFNLQFTHLLRCNMR